MRIGLPIWRRLINLKSGEKSKCALTRSSVPSQRLPDADQRR
jgi:hypothetical protein